MLSKLLYPEILIKRSTLPDIHGTLAEKPSLIIGSFNTAYSVAISSIREPDSTWKSSWADRDLFHNAPEFSCLL